MPKSAQITQRQFIAARQSSTTVEQACSTLRISKSTYYRYAKRIGVSAEKSTEVHSVGDMRVLENLRVQPSLVADLNTYIPMYLKMGVDEAQMAINRAMMKIHSVTHTCCPVPEVCQVPTFHFIFELEQHRRVQEADIRGHIDEKSGSYYGVDPECSVRYFYAYLDEIESRITMANHRSRIRSLGFDDTKRTIDRERARNSSKS